MPDKQGRHSILTLRNIPFIPVSMEKSHLNTQAGTEASVKKMNIFLKNEDIFSCSNDAYTARDTDIFSQKKKWVGGTPFANNVPYRCALEDNKLKVALHLVAPHQDELAVREVSGLLTGFTRQCGTLK